MYSFTRNDKPRSSSFWMTSSSDFDTEVRDGEQVVFPLLHELTDRVDPGPLEAVAGALRQVELLDREIEVGRRRRGRSHLTELEAAGLVGQLGDQLDELARRVAGRGERVAWRDRTVGLDLERELSKFVDCSTRVGSIENDTRRTGEKIASTGITPIVIVRLLRSADR